MEAGYSQIRKLLNELCYLTLEHEKNIPGKREEIRSKGLTVNPLGT